MDENVDEPLTKYALFQSYYYISFESVAQCPMYIEPTCDFESTMRRLPPSMRGKVRPTYRGIATFAVARPPPCLTFC